MPLDDDNEGRRRKTPHMELRWKDLAVKIFSYEGLKCLVFIILIIMFFSSFREAIIPEPMKTGVGFGAVIMLFFAFIVGLKWGCPSRTSTIRKNPFHET